LIKIALDAMGGDNAPHDVVHGGIEAARLSKGRFEVVLVGNRVAVQKEIGRHFHTSELPISIIHASDSVAMDEQPSVALRNKETSIAIALALHKDREVDAVVSAGNTGAVMASALFSLKRVRGIRRPAIGANVDSRPHDLLQFGIMGAIFYSHLYSEPKPRVGLLSVGRESVKGNETTVKTHALFSDYPFNFIGNVEGGDILKGEAEVVVCDGFIGNVILKFAESLHGLFKASMRKLVRKYIFSQFGAVLMKPAFDGIRKIFDYQEYGGAPLLGVQGCCIIAHGRSTPRAITNAILAAYKTAIENVNQHIMEQVSKLTLPDAD
jgi:glycerol-3-phosphate acyltransferase PlsX